MNIKSEKFIVELSHDELWEIALDLRFNLLNKVAEHWVKYQDSWVVNNKEKLHLIETMFTHLARPDLYKDIFSLAQEIFDNYNNAKK